MHKRQALLALAILLAAACGKSRSVDTGGMKGVFGQTFGVQVFQPTNGNVVRSADGAINCGGGGACSASFPWSTTVTLTAVPAAGQQFELWAGDCYGTGDCVLDTSRYGADKYVVGVFNSSSEPRMHPNFTDPTVHGPAYSNETYSCSAAACHGPTLAGAGIAPACAHCHEHATLITMGVCADCHAVKMTQWASPGDLHALPAADVLTYSEDGGATFPHNTAELLNDNCVKCHSMFQAPLGITHFVNPAGYDTSGLPMYCAEDVAGLIISGTSTTCTAGNIYQGPWTLSNTADWQATKCQVCHDPLSTSPAKLAKYGAMLDQPFDPSYIDLSAASQALYPDQTWLTTPYQYVFDGTSAYVQTNMTAGNAVGLTANKLCSSCHDPDDQGGDPNAVVGAVDYGPQGGDSRAYVTASHAGMTCVDCHQTHDFTPADPALTSSCSTSTCHGGALPAGPGKVHTNHL